VTSNTNLRINEVALTQVLPAGWEIENTRLTGAAMPEWLQAETWRYGSEEYVDIRDDRVIWFFDLLGQYYPTGTASVASSSPSSSTP